MARSDNLTYKTRKDPLTEEETPAEGKRKVFISYKKTDNQLYGVRDIAAKKILNKADVAVWYDENLTPGANYRDEIIKAISESDALVLLLTPDIMKSDFVWNTEVKTAQEQKKGIIPIAFNLPESEHRAVEEKIGHEIEILHWPSGSGDEKGKLSDKYMQEGMKFDEAFGRALDMFVINADLAKRVEQFFASNKHKLPYKDLSDEQKYLMGVGYLREIGTDKDEKKGVKILNSVVNTYGEDDETKELIGRAAVRLSSYYYGIDNYDKSFEYDKLGADAGYAVSMGRLGYCYSKGQGVKEDKKKAVEWYTKAAEAGDAKAMYNLAWMYYDGEGVEQDKKKTVELFTKAAESGDAGAMFNLGVMYNKGEGVSQDKKKAVAWYSKAAEAGNARAMFNLGVIYKNGDGVEQDKKKAVEWYSKAAEAGNAGAMFNLGLMYKYGEGVEQDKRKAVEWYSKAAEAGNAGAMCNLGLMFDNGEGVSQDKKKAVEWFTKGAEAGDAKAMNNLGLMYYNGEGVSQDKKKAVELFTKAADGGDEFGMTALGVMYAKGDGVKKDKKKAVELFSKAVEAGENTAAGFLGKMYRDGNGVKKDKKKAIELFTKASQSDAEKVKDDALKALSKLTKKKHTGGIIAGASALLLAGAAAAVQFTGTFDIIGWVTSLFN